MVAQISTDVVSLQGGQSMPVYMLLKMTVLMASFVTLGAFLRQLSKSVVLAPRLGSRRVFYTPLFLMIFNT